MFQVQHMPCLSCLVQPLPTCCVLQARSQRSYARHWRFGPLLRATGQQASDTATAHNQLESRFNLLASALAPGARLTAGYTPLGRGLVASQPVPGYTAMLAVEWANILCVTDEPRKDGTAFSKRVLQDWQLLHHAMPPLLVAYLLGSSGDADWFLRLTAWMLFLANKVEHGPLALYKQLLPKAEDMCCLMNYLPEERIHLQSRALDALAAKEREEIFGLHARVFSSESGELRSLSLATSPEETLWAACMVNSRCFSEKVAGEVVSMVVPCADMANHLNDPNAAYVFNPRTDCFELVSLRDIAQGEEVCISYGCRSKDNTELMRDYGFIQQANPNDRVPFRTGTDVASRLAYGDVPPPSLHAAHLQATLQFAAQASQLSQQAVARLPAILGSLQPFLRPGTLPSSRAASLGRQPAAATTSGAVTAAAGRAAPGSTAATAGRPSPVGQATAVLTSSSRTGASLSEAERPAERRSVDVLLEQCRAMLAAHGTSIETDEALLGGHDGLSREETQGMQSARVRQAVVWRLERKRLIAAAEESLRLYAQGLS